MILQARRFLIGKNIFIHIKDICIRVELVRHCGKIYKVGQPVKTKKKKKYKKKKI